MGSELRQHGAAMGPAGISARRDLALLAANAETLLNGRDAHAALALLDNVNGAVCLLRVPTGNPSAASGHRICFLVGSSPVRERITAGERREPPSPGYPAELASGSAAAALFTCSACPGSFSWTSQ